MANRVTKPSSALPISERRRFIRHPLCFPLTYTVIERAHGPSAAKTAVKAHGKENKTTTINVSMGGLLFAAKRPVKVDSIIMIRMPFQDKIFNVRAKVVHCDKNPETKLYNIGCAFHRLGAAYKVKLVEQLYLISEFRDLKSIELGREISLEKASQEWIKRYSDRFRKLYW
jgi:c-di-GMP-binding flagellar brake protein YcgR